MGYKDEIQKEIDTIYKMNPAVKQIIEEMKKLDDISEFEFDVSNEREVMKARYLRDLLDNMD